MISNEELELRTLKANFWVVYVRDHSGRAVMTVIIVTVLIAQLEMKGHNITCELEVMYANFS